jgi:hypothetical protein
MNNDDFHTTSAYIQNRAGDKIIYPFGPPLYQTVISDEFCQSLLDQGNTLSKKTNDASFTLAGNLLSGRSLVFSDDYTEQAEKYLLPKIRTFLDMLDQQHQVAKPTTSYDTLYLKSLWINYSHKHDFNPPHDHNGDLSFVIYCDVPAEMFEVQADSNAQDCGKIIFMYGETFSDLMFTNFKIKPFKNLMLVFPSKLRHFVPPYWTNSTRISVSGNFVRRT